ncbi:mitochondrial import inner membrane translocase subunit Tim9-like [Rhopilema esculentum]|uniref:mitochondrial import inner membrane translocase subunit Tim9-like n=1 Tax=Rhopilema esculentum TaxID=499914 RepID=UPI0031D0D918|eukprot:gene3024-1290_t
MSVAQMPGAQMESGQIKAFLSTYNKLAEQCFVDCVHDFTSRTVTGNENNCAMNCTEKFLKMSQRIGIRFQEIHEINQSALLQK